MNGGSFEVDRLNYSYAPLSLSDSNSFHFSSLSWDHSPTTTGARSTTLTSCATVPCDIANIDISSTAPPNPAIFAPSLLQSILQTWVSYAILLHERSQLTSLAAWQVMLMNVRTEGVLALNTICTADQIKAMAGAEPLCADDERGNSSVVCRCCLPIGANSCSTLVDPRTSLSTGLLSYLARLDGAHIVSYDTPAMPLVDGANSSSQYRPIFHNSFVCHLYQRSTVPQFSL